MKNVRSYLKDNNQSIRGVNLGSWLLIEKWMLEDGPLYQLVGNSELDILTSNDMELTSKLVKSHHREYITEDDFLWLSKRSINSVRIPIGYWLLYDLLEKTFDKDPFYKFKSIYKEGHTYLDHAFDWADKHNLSILIDLHGLPGGQNDDFHSGSSAHDFWRYYDCYNNYLIQIVRILDHRYCNRSSYLGISLCNEPKCSKEQLSKALNDWDKCLNECKGWIVLPQTWETNDRPSIYNEYYNYDCLHPIDSHFYYCFTDNITINQILNTSILDRKKEIISTVKNRPLIIGEWSMALSESNFGSITEEQKDLAKEKFAQTQIGCYSLANAWYFWSYKCRYDGWSFIKSYHILASFLQ